MRNRPSKEIKISESRIENSRARLTKLRKIENSKKTSLVAVLTPSRKSSRIMQIMKSEATVYKVQKVEIKPKGKVGRPKKIRPLEEVPAVPKN